MHDNHFFHVSLKLVLRNEKGEILILKMPDNSSMAGYYDLPGGRISKEKYDVPFEETIKREIQEELGEKVKYEIKKRPVSYSVHTVPAKPGVEAIQILMLFFEANYKGGEIVLSDEHKESDWKKVAKSNVKKLFVRGLLQGMSNYLNFK